MSLPNEDVLKEKQERMRRRVQRRNVEKEQKFINRPLCISCKRRRARLNGPYCSRCTAKGMVNNLRDTLPGVSPKPPDKYCVTQNNGECVSDNPKDMHNLNPKEQIFTRAQAAEILGISSTTLIRWERRGVIPPPVRLAHNNQCVYTKEMIDLAANYKTSVYVAPTVTSTPGTVESLPRVAKAAPNFNKVEKSVARSLSSLGRLLR